jgi:excisionase family DNA binding protein
LTVKEAAKELGVSEQFIRIGLQQERLPIGAAVKMPGGRWSYLIIDGQVKEYLRKEET